MTFWIYHLIIAILYAVVGVAFVLHGGWLYVILGVGWFAGSAFWVWAALLKRKTKLRTYGHEQTHRNKSP